MKKVSIIIPTYKRPTQLNRAIKSVLFQTYKNIEIIVVDDNEDNSIYRRQTEETMKAYVNIKEIKYIKNKTNINGAASRNVGIKASKGEYISFLDDDDYYYPEKIEKEITFLETNKRYDCVYCWREDVVKKHKGTYDGNISKEILIGKYYPGTPTLMFRRDALFDIGLFNECFKRNQDLELLLKYCRKYEIAHIPYIGVYVGLNDRSNEISAQELEKVKSMFLNNFSSYIYEISKQNRKIYKQILISNKLSVAFKYLKQNDINNAFRIISYCNSISLVMTLRLSLIRIFEFTESYIKRKIIIKNENFD